MKLTKLKNIVAFVLIGVMLLAFTGCNYIDRPDGAKNNSADNSNRIAKLLIQDQEVEKKVRVPATWVEDEVETPTEYGNDYPIDDPIPDTPSNTDTEPDPEPVNSDTPFNAPGDVITKINDILGSISSEVTEATSATGVRDELMTSRMVNVYMPYTLYDDQNATVDAIASNLNMSIRLNVIPNNYVASVKREVLAGNKADLMYVDQQSWGYTQHFTQELSDFVNFELGDKLGTYSSLLSNKFRIESGGKAKRYVASGIASPYLLVYNPDNISVPDVTFPADPENEISELKVEDPLKMFNEGNWCISAFTEILKASTTSGRVGLASIIDDDDNLDMWLGMDDNASLTIEPETLIATVDTSIISRECLDTVGEHMDKIQSWYWSELGLDKSNYVGAWTDKSEWDITVSKLFGKYSGTDPITSFSFMTVNSKDYASVKSAADRAGVGIEFVALPYGVETEKIIRSAEDPNLTIYDNNGMVVNRYAAGWAGGFSVLKTCEKPSVSLRAGEEITKAWKANFEQPLLDLMTEDQQVRYQKMKENIGISFYRSVVYNASTAFDIYGSNVLDRLLAENRPAFSSLQKFSDAQGNVLTQPMYRKNETVGIYEASTFDKWSEFYHGKVDPIDGVSPLSNSLLPTISAAFIPPSMLFIN